MKDLNITNIIAQAENENSQEELTNFFIEFQKFYLWVNEQFPQLIKHLNQLNNAQKDMIERVGKLENIVLELTAKKEPVVTRMEVGSMALDNDAVKNYIASQMKSASGVSTNNKLNSDGQIPMSFSPTKDSEDSSK